MRQSGNRQIALPATIFGRFFVVPSPTPCSRPLLKALISHAAPIMVNKWLKSQIPARKNRKSWVISSGGCQCGAVRFRGQGTLGKAGICHCRMCQKAFGSWGAALVSVPAEYLTWTRGQPSLFRSSAIVARGFCAKCGTPLYMHEDGDDNFELAIGAFDEPSRVARSPNR